MSKQVGVITIGQTPRTDMIPAIRNFFPADTTIIEKGILDNKSKQQLHCLYPNSHETKLVSRLRDGTQIEIAKEKILPFFQPIIDTLNKQNVAIIILACTGNFPTFRSTAPIIYPDHLMNHVVKGLIRESKIGLIIPKMEQNGFVERKWKAMGFQDIVIKNCSPYNYNINELVQVAKDWNEIDLIIMDCIGYTNEAKAIIRENVKIPVLLSRNVIYRLSAEMI